MTRAEFGSEPPRPQTAAREAAGRDALEVGRNRLLAIAGVFAVAFVVLAGRLVEVTVLRGGGPADYFEIAPELRFQMHRPT